MISCTLLFIPLRFHELYRAILLQVESGIGGLTWWGALLALGLVILLLVLALAWNASKTTVPELEHPIVETHEALEPPSAHEPEDEPDDLTRIEGIGPKISDLLQENGITSFERLADTKLDELEALLRESGLQFADATTWAEQASLAAKADWDELDALQERLKGGSMEQI